MTQKQITNEIINSQLKLTLQVERLVTRSRKYFMLKYDPLEKYLCVRNNIMFLSSEEPSLCPALTRSGPRRARGGRATPGGRGWGWSTSWRLAGRCCYWCCKCCCCCRPCNTTALATCRSPTTSPRAAAWVSRSTRCRT